MARRETKEKKIHVLERNIFALGFEVGYFGHTEGYGWVDNVKNKLEDRARGISPVAVKEKVDNREPVCLLDVRSDAEYTKVHIPGSTLIPLPQLQNRADEVPRDREIAVVCGVGLRAYKGCLKLKALGFENVAFLDGGVTAWPYGKE